MSRRAGTVASSTRAPARRSASVTQIGSVAPTLATMIGLGVGIDYSLFIVTRHRQNLDAGMDINDSIGLANGTAGQAVLIAGGTVVIAITGLALSGIPYVTRLGFMSAIAVAVMMAAELAQGSEERRVGKECGYQCRSRWSPYH